MTSLEIETLRAHDLTIEQLRGTLHSLGEHLVANQVVHLLHGLAK